MKTDYPSPKSRRQFLHTTALGALGLGLYPPIKTNPAVAAKYFNRRIPNEAHQKMGQLANKTITTFAFTPSNGWVMATKEGPYFARNIPEECYQKLGEFVKKGAEIYCIAFPPQGGNRWVITTSKGLFARNIPEACYQKMLTYHKAGHKIKHVAFPPGRTNSWVIVSSGPFFARNIDDECYQMMRNLTAGGRKLSRVAFAKKNNGWLVIAQDNFFARRIDEECYQKMLSFHKDNWHLHNVAFAPVNSGWSIYSSGKNASLPKDKVRSFENNFTDGGRGKTDIWARMKTHKTQGCAVAVVLNNKLAWSTAYGFLEKGDFKGATHPESRFQAASISKPVAAMGVMKLVEETRNLKLDDDIRPRLNWTLPTRSCLNLQGIPTIKRVIRHRSGIIGRDTTWPLNQCDPNFNTGGGGFAGYAPGNAVPSLLDIMNDNNTNSRPFELTTNPGSKYAYSGEGYVLLQRMIEQVSGMGFAQYMKQKIFQPLGLDHSTYNLNTPPYWISERKIAAGHRTNGEVIPGKRNFYPESAAAGLYSSVEDLAQILRYLNRKWAKQTSQGPLSQSSVTNLLSGTGFSISGSTNSSNYSYSHNGANFGFRCEFRGYPNKGAGYAIMTNSDSDTLLYEAVDAVKGVYGWA